VANYDYIKETGVIIPDTASVLGEVEQEYKDGFDNQSLDTAPTTPQGVLITAETSARKKYIDNNAGLANPINPNIAGGIFFDAIWAFTGGKRDDARRTIVVATLTGVAGTVVPSLSRAQTGAGDVFETISNVTIPGAGTIDATFQSVEEGAIPCGAGALTQITEGNVLGWETVNNTDPGILGGAAQSDASARKERNNEISLQGSALVQAITSNLWALDDVTGVQYRENFTSSPVTIDNVPLVEHSIWVGVDGATDLEVATTINNNKSGGCNYNNAVGIAVSQEVIDPYSNQAIDILFSRPELVPVLVRATIEVFGGVADPEGATKQAILDYANGELENFPGFILGNSVSPFQISGAVTGQVDGIYVQLMEVSLTAPVSYQSTEIPLELWQKATLQLTDISVVVV